MKRDLAKARAWENRSSGLAQGKGLARTNPLLRSSPLGATNVVPTPRKRLPPRSAKRNAQAPIRRALVVAMLTAAPRCQAQVLCRGDQAQDVHERLSRARGGDICDPVQSHAMTICRPCHNWVTTHPAEAEAMRLALHSWHVCPPIGPC